MYSAKGETERIALFHFAGIGDTLMLTPMVSVLRERFPHARIDLVMCHPYVGEAFKERSFFNDAVPYRFSWVGYKAFFRIGNRSSAVLKVLRHHPHLYLALAKKRYQISVDCNLSNESRNLSRSLAYALRIRKRIGFGEDHLSMLTDQVPFDTTKTRIALYGDLLTSLGGVAELGERQYCMTMRETELSWVAEYFSSSGAASSTIVALNPGGAELNVPRRWPVENYIALGKWLLLQEGVQVLLIGGKEDVSICDRIAEALEGRCINTCGKTDVGQTAALLSRCTTLVTNDTGALHLAAAVGVPHVIALFGPTDAKLLVPPGRGITALSAKIACAPCAGSIINRETKTCVTTPPGACLRSIRPASVIKVLESVLRCSRSVPV